jgi:release factor glutamine methyltransferase
MTYRQAFVEGARRLAAAPVPTETPDLDARVLLGHCAGLSHAGLLARWGDPVATETEARYAQALARREAGEPVAWVTGTKEFLGLDFSVGPGLLVPRADTETLVEAALEVLGDTPVPGTPPRVVDLCTGTGCVAVGLAVLSPRPLEVWAGDLSPQAVATAGQNAARLVPAGRSVRVLASDLFDHLPGPWDLVVSNPPYLTPAETIERVGPGGWKEPALALDGGGDDGLDLIRRLVAQAVPRMAPGAWILLEAADAQMDGIGALFEASGLGEVRFWTDLAGHRRVAGARRELRP